MYVTKISFVLAVLSTFGLSEINGQSVEYLRSYDPSSGYNISDPNSWSLDYPNCAGNRQSPVDINTHDAVNLNNVTNLQFFNYGITPINMTLYNPGIEVQILPTYNDNETPHVMHGLLNGDYVLQRLFFYFGLHRGSFHTIDGRSYPLEMHVAHYKRDYGDFPTALAHADGIVVIAYFIQINETGSPGFAKFTDYITEITAPNTTFDIEPFPLNDFGLDISDYYTYEGSMSIPPCSETVTYIISRTPIPATEQQVEQLRDINFIFGISINNRPMQPLNDRKILHVLPK